MESLFSDLRYALRLLRKNPGFTLVAVLTLALGIGANTTIFSVINSILLRPLPYPDPDRLVAVFQTDIHEPGSRNIVSAPNYLDWQRLSHVFEQMALFDSAGRGYDLSSGGQQPERVSGLRVSASFFPLLGVKPFLGRSFLPEEELAGKDHEVVLSYGLWQRRYAGDRALLGHTIRIDGEAYTVVGVMPRGFQFQFWSDPRQLWVPVGYTRGDRERGSNSFIVFARLKRGTTLATAAAEMDTIGRSLSQQYPQDNPAKSAGVDLLKDIDIGNLRASLLALFAAVGFVLLIACVNVANLMLARGEGRQKEMAMRCALGAGRARVVRQLLAESVLLSLLGGMAGVLLAAWTTRLLVKVLPEGLRFIPFRPLDDISLDAKVFAFAFLAACLTGILSGLTPALGAFRSDLNDLVRQGGRGASNARGNRFRYALVASEVALAMVVLAGAGLMIESMARLLGVNPGFNPKNVLATSMTTPQNDLYYGPPVHERFCLDLEEKVGALPGVLSVSSVAHLPLQGGAGRGFVIEGRPDPGAEKQPGAGFSVACPNFLRTMGIPLIAGREFTHADTVHAPGVILINQSMARRYWPNEDPLGRRIKIGLFRSDGPWLTIVGVYADVRHYGLDQKVEPEFLRPYTQHGWPSMTVIARTASAPGGFANPVKNALAQMDPDRAASEMETLEDVVRDSVGSRRFPMFILASLALLALVLAAVGIAGVVGYSVAQRTNEIGIRMALGARALDVLRLVITRSMQWTLTGVVLGFLGALGITRFLSNMLYDVLPTDPFVLTAVALILAAVALLASYLPARRAAKIDPMVALRYE